MGILTQQKDRLKKTSHLLGKIFVGDLLVFRSKIFKYPFDVVAQVSGSRKRVRLGLRVMRVMAFPKSRDIRFRPKPLIFEVIITAEQRH